MKRFIAGLVAGLLVAGSVSAAGKLFVVEPFSAEMTEAEVIACIKAGGEGAVLFDLELYDDSYTAQATGNACITESK